MGLRGEEERGSQREEKKWYGRIMAEEMLEGKGLSVQTSLFLTQAKLSNPQDRKEKMQLRGLALRSTDSTQDISGFGWERCDELHPGMSTTFEGIKERVVLFYFILLTHTCSSAATQLRPDEGGERHLQDWQTAEYWSHVRFSKVNCKLPASLF